MSDKDTCPANGCNLQGDPIPQASIDAGHYAPGVTHFSRLIGVQILGTYDGICYWACPDCGARWHRFTSDTNPRDRRIRREVEEAWASADAAEKAATG